MENQNVQRLEGSAFVKALISVFGYEMFGTMMLVFAVNASTVPVGIMLMFFSTILICGPITGGHINPAVTLGVFVLNYSNAKSNLLWLAVYWIAQISGAMMGVLMVWLAFSNSNVLGGSSLHQFAHLKPAIYMTSSNVFFVEWFCTTFFLTVISLAVNGRTSPELSQDSLLPKLAIAMSLGGIIFAVGPHTGGCFNPAVAISQSVLASPGFGDDPDVAQHTMTYILATMLGGFTAGLFGLMNGRVHLNVAIDEVTRAQRENPK
jgi:glycerol uptake facilitator-like aquaporin